MAVLKNRELYKKSSEENRKKLAEFFNSKEMHRPSNIENSGLKFKGHNNI